MFSFLKPIVRLGVPGVGLVVALALLLAACGTGSAAAPTPTAPLNSQVCGPDCGPPPANTPRPSPTPKPPTPTPTPLPPTTPPRLVASPTAFAVSQGGCARQVVSNGDTQFTCQISLSTQGNPLELDWSASAPSGGVQASPPQGCLSAQPQFTHCPSQSTLTVTLYASTFLQTPGVLVTLNCPYNQVTLTFTP